jgi:N6-adenosine-specific RNA methylase IME4
MYPELPRIELFARGPARPGWSVWGNQACAPFAAEAAALHDVIARKGAGA